MAMNHCDAIAVEQLPVFKTACDTGGKGGWGGGAKGRKILKIWVGLFK